MVMIPKNTPIPVQTTKIFPNITNESQSISLSIYEGEDEIAINNKLLGRFTLRQDEFEKSEIGSEQMRLTFILENKGILTIKVIGTLSTNTVSFKLIQ